MAKFGFKNVLMTGKNETHIGWTSLYSFISFLCYWWGRGDNYEFSFSLTWNDSYARSAPWVFTSPPDSPIGPVLADHGLCCGSLTHNPKCCLCIIIEELGVRRNGCPSTETGESGGRLVWRLRWRAGLSNFVIEETMKSPTGNIQQGIGNMGLTRSTSTWRGEGQNRE